MYQYYYTKCIERLADTFHNLSDPLDDNHWYLPKHVHAQDFIIVNLVSLIIFLVAKSKAPKIPIREGINPKSLLCKLVAIILLFNLGFNVAYKLMKGPRYIVFMLQPCHIVSAIYAYLLWTTNIRLGSKIHHFTLYYIVVTVSALLFPDTTDLIRPGEFTNFFVQHYALLITPFLLQIFKFPARHAWSYSIMSAALLTMAHFIVFEIVSLATGVNVNYMLSPPPLGFDLESTIATVTHGYLTHHAYRIICAVPVIIASWILGLIVIAIGNIIELLTPARSKKNQSKQKYN